MKILIDVSFCLIAMILMVSFVYACDLKPVEGLPAHLIPNYCSCYNKTFLRSQSLLPREQHARLICAGRSWDIAHKEYLKRRKYDKA
jgi:hypothetical protein